MSIPLSQLMQIDDPDVGPLRGAYTICLAPKLSVELEAATARYTESEAALKVAREDAESDRERPGRQRRVGQKSTLKELEEKADRDAAEADEIRERMLARSIELQLVVDEDRWAEFTREHPARDEDDDPTGARRDRFYGIGLCNVDELLKIIDHFITRYGDERPADGSWAFVKANSAPGERDGLAAKIVRMHTAGVDLGKSRTALRNSQRLATDSE
ncbi:hypothetical protein [Nocardioides aquiterrae]|uniref:Uncharacterized protein n=1 Tax=Nocardioides aquiterrae TaxID=203799 RepID=A0ABN1UC05_9ACTN